MNNLFASFYIIGERTIQKNISASDSSDIPIRLGRPLSPDEIPRVHDWSIGRRWRRRCRGGVITSAYVGTGRGRYLGRWRHRVHTPGPDDSQGVLDYVLEPGVHVPGEAGLGAAGRTGGGDQVVVKLHCNFEGEG